MIGYRSRSQILFQSESFAAIVIMTNHIYHDCAVPEQIHTHPMEGHWKFRGGGGSQKGRILEGKYEA